MSDLACEKCTSESRLPRGAMPFCTAAAILLLAIAIAMGPIAKSGFSYWDDEDTISLNTALNPPTWTGLAQRWTWPHLHIYIPLTHTVWNALALMSPRPPAGAIGNVEAWPFKMTNLGVHALTSVLVLLILRRLVGRNWISLMAALAFAIHPVQVEAVAWASGLKDLLFGLFATGCILAYLDSPRERAPPRGKMIVLALLLLVLAGLSKPTAMVVPAMLLALDLLWLRRALTGSVARLVPFACIGLAFAALAWRIQPAVAQSELPSAALRPLIAVDTLAFYAGKLLLPLNLAYDYGRTATVALNEMRAVPWRFAIKCTFVLGMITTAILLRRRRPLLVLGLWWTALALGPVLGLTYFDFSHYSTVADHYAYMPMLGVALILAALLQAGCRVRATKAISTVIAIAWIALSCRQTLTWRDAHAVTLQTLRVNENSYASWSNLALAELRAGNLDEAERHARHAVELQPLDPQSLFILANVLQQRGRNDSAIELIRKALVLSPYSAAYHHRLAALLGKRGDVREALAELEQTLAIDPAYPQAIEERDKLLAFSRLTPATRPAQPQ